MEKDTFRGQDFFEMIHMRPKEIMKTSYSMHARKTTPKLKTEMRQRLRCCRSAKEPEILRAFTARE